MPPSRSASARWPGESPGTIRLLLILCASCGFVVAIAKAKRPGYRCQMQVEKLKYVIWAKDLDRAGRFYQEVFDAEIVRRSDVITELAIAGSILTIHTGGQAERTWTGLSFQVADLFAACNLLREAGGLVLREPQDTPEEPAHLAMCADSEGGASIGF